MTQNQDFHRQFSLLFDGNPWLEVNILSTLENLTAGKAAHKPSFPGNSIWEITNHLISWRQVVLQRVKGENSPTPDHNYFLEVSDKSQAAWENTLASFRGSQKLWLDFFQQTNEARLKETPPESPYCVSDLAHGILQHDAYHLGQIALMAKYDL